MRLEGWHAMVFLALQVAAVVAVVLVFLWAVRPVRKRKPGGSSLPPNRP
jgi:hypothetical protein